MAKIICHTSVNIKHLLYTKHIARTYHGEPDRQGPCSQCIYSLVQEYQASIRVMGDGSTLEEHLTQPRAPGKGNKT